MKLNVIEKIAMFKEFYQYEHECLLVTVVRTSGKVRKHLRFSLFNC